MKIIHSKKLFIQVKNGLSPRARLVSSFYIEASLKLTEYCLHDEKMSEKIAPVFQLLTTQGAEIKSAHSGNFQIIFVLKFETSEMTSRP